MAKAPTVPSRPVRTAPARRWRTRGRARAATVAVLALLVAGALVGPLARAAGAHAGVIATSPGPAAVLEQPPDRVSVEFTEAVDPKLGGMVVYDGRGARVDTGRLRQPAPDRLVLPIDADLADGSYIVTWRVVSADGHSVQGTWTFRVGDAGAAPEDLSAVAAGLLAGQETDPSVAFAWGVVRWLVFAALALLVGGAAFAAAVWPATRASRATRRIVLGGWVACTAATVVGLPLFGAYSSGGGPVDVLDPAGLRDALGTRLGSVWLLRLALLLVALGLVRMLLALRTTDPVPRWWWWTAGAVGGALVATPGLAGHASTLELPVVAVAADAAHTAAMAVWIGGLVVLVAVVLRGRDVERMEGAITRFSRVALVCVGVLVVTGTYQSWRLVGSFAALREDEFGRLLVVKLICFAVMLVVASFSREIVARVYPPVRAAPAPDPDPVPAGVPVVRGGALDLADRPPPADGGDPGDGAAQDREVRRLRWSVALEVVVAAVVLAVTAMLVNTAPPADGAVFGEGVAGVRIEHPQVTLDVTTVPGSAGINDLHVNTYSPAGAPLPVAAVDLRLSLPARDVAPLLVPLRQLGPGHYLSPGLDLPLAGAWRVEATIRITAVDRVDLTGTLDVR
jgi:copper transport protein